jgi:hypothetical protein
LRGSVEDSEVIKADLKLILGSKNRKSDIFSYKSEPSNNTYLCVVNNCPNIDM